MPTAEVHRIPSESDCRSPNSGAISKEQVALGAGLHAGVIELASERSLQVRLANGVRVSAVRGDVDPDLIDECIRNRRLVVLMDTPLGIAVVGALQTQRSFERRQDGTLCLQARRVEVEAEDELRLRSGATKLSLRADGRVRLNGNRMTMDVNTNVRILSALVELP